MSKKQQNLWHAMEPDAVLSALRTDSTKGLSGKEAALRRLKRGENAIWCVRRTSVWEMVRSEFIDLSAILLIITALLSAVFTEGGNAAILIGILAASAAIRTAICVVVHRVFEEAARANIPHTSVIRGGKLRTLPADAVVPGDILLLEVGAPVVADVRILAGEVVVTEIGVTDNRDPQRKSPAYVLSENTACEERMNILFAGSTVVGGSGRGVVVASGEETYVFARRGRIHIPAGENLQILTRLSGWSRSVSLVMIAAVLLISLGGAFLGQSDVALDSLFLSALALAVASMSEFLCVIASILLASTVQRLHSDSEGGTVLRAADSIEDFAEARCLILSDPRLLRSGKLRLHSAFFSGRDLSGEENASAAVRLLALSLLCRCGSVYPVSVGGEAVPSRETTEKIRTLYQSYDDAVRAAFTPPGVTEITQNDRLYTALTQSPEGPLAYVCGSLTDVLSCCSEMDIDGQPVSLTPQIREQLLEQAHMLARASITTVCVAHRLSPYTTLSRPSALQTKMTLMGYIAIADPVESDLARLVEKCKAGGIRIVVLTESDEEECQPAVEAGILSPHARVLSGTESWGVWLAAESNSESAAGNLCIRVRDKSTRQKVVREITGRIPKTVYIGDKLRDILLFDEAAAAIAADCHFSKGPQCLFSAADVSVQFDTELRSAGAADAIRVIAACKGAFLRLRGITEYLLSTQTLRLVVMIAAAFFGVPMLTPVQLLWWGMILDLMAVLTFAFSHRDDDALVLPQDALRLPSFGGGLLFPVVSGVLTGLLVSFAAALSVRLLPLADPLPVVYIGGVLSSLLFLVSIRSFGKTRSVRVNVVGVLYSALLVVTVIASAFRADLTACLFALLPPLAAPVLRFFYRRAGREAPRKK